LAIESGLRSNDEVTAFRLEACVCVALGALGALFGLVPGLSKEAYAVALRLVPSHPRQDEAGVGEPIAGER